MACRIHSPLRFMSIHGLGPAVVENESIHSRPGAHPPNSSPLFFYPPFGHIPLKHAPSFVWPLGHKFALVFSAFSPFYANPQAVECAGNLLAPKSFPLNLPKIAVDWLHKQLLAAAASISPTHRAATSASYRRHLVKNGGTKARTTPLVDVDQKVILLARSSSSSGGSSSIHAASTSKRQKRCSSSDAKVAPINSNGTSNRNSRNVAVKQNGLQAVQQQSVSFALNSVAEQQQQQNQAQQFIDDDPFGLGICSTHSTPTRKPLKNYSSCSNSSKHNGMLKNNSERINKAFQYSPPAAHHPRHPCPLPPPHPLFIAWPPVPVLHRPTAIPQPEYHTSRRRSHSTATRSTTQATATSPSSTSASSSPFRHIQSTLRSARRSILHKGSTREYTRVPEEEGEEEWDHQQAGTSAASAIAAQHTASARQTKASRNQQRIRRLQQYTSSRPVSAAFPKNYGSSEGGQKMAPYKLDVVLQMPPPSQEEAEKHGWDPDDRSINIYVKEEDKLTLHRHPVAQSTDCIRGKIGFKRGFHVWQINWPSNQRGTHAVIGVATKSCPLQVAGYVSLVGLDTEGFGWDIVENKCYHNSKSTKGWTYPPEKLQHLFEQSTTIAAAFRAPEKLFCILDMDEGQLSFATESKYLGVAFAGLKGKHLYPAVSAVWGHCEVTMRYLGGLDPEPKHLMEICRQRIRVEMGTSRLHRVNELNIPPSLRQFLLYN